MWSEMPYSRQFPLSRRDVTIEKNPDFSDTMDMEIGYTTNVLHLVIHA